MNAGPDCSMQIPLQEDAVGFSACTVHNERICPECLE